MIRQAVNIFAESAFPIRYIHRKVYAVFLLICLMAAVFLFAGKAFAKDIAFETLLDRDTIQMGQSAQLQIRFEGSTDVPSPELPKIEGLQSRYVGPSTMMSIVNGRMSSSVTHIYSLVPLKTGTFRIGPFSFEYEGDRYSSGAVSLEVLDSASHSQSGGRTQEPVSPEKDLKDRVFVRIQAEKSRVYLNEIIPLSIKFYVSGVSVRDIQYPELKHEYISAAEFDKPLRRQEQKGGVTYEVMEFRTRIFAAKAGRLELGPVLMKANVAARKNRRMPSTPFDNFFNDDFFGGYELVPIELASNKETLEVLPLPDRNRPADFKGAVGNFSFNLSASPSEVRIGDPVTLKMTVAGEGNFSTVTGPVLINTDGFKTYDPQVKQEAKNKTFEQVLMPMTDSVKNIPVASFSFFNPVKEQYQTIVQGPIPVKVTRPENRENAVILDTPSGGSPVKNEILGKDIIYIKGTPGDFRETGKYLYSSTWFQLLQIVPLLMLISAWVMKKKRERLSSDTGYARRLLAPGKAKKGIREAEDFLSRNMRHEYYDSVFKTLREYLGNRFHVPSGGITAGAVDDILKDRNLAADTMGKIKHILELCDMARYAPSVPDTAQMKELARELKEVIDYLERHKEL